MAKYSYFVGVTNKAAIATFHPEIYQNPLDWKQVSKAEYARAREAYAVSRLVSLLKPGQNVYVSLKHRSASGMSRVIQVLTVDGSEIIGISRLVADALGWRYSDKYGGVVVAGSGMDMGFHLVHALGWVIWPNGTPAPHGTRNGVPDCDGGYALKHVWL